MAAQITTPLVLVVLLACIAVFTQGARQNSDVFYALNAGGSGVVGSNGVVYLPDVPSKAEPEGTGATVPIEIKRASPADQAIFQTERYASESFRYFVPTPPDGSYVLVLRFAEVWWRSIGQKVFSVLVNEEHFAVTDFDIFETAGGYGVAHDEHIPFRINGGKLSLNEESVTSDVGKSFSIEFVKSAFDNPKICAIVIVKGDVKQSEQLLPLAPPVEAGHENDEGYDDIEEDEEDEDMEDHLRANRDYQDDSSELRSRKEKSQKSSPQMENKSAPGFPFAILAVIGIVIVVLTQFFF